MGTQFKAKGNQSDSIQKKGFKTISKRVGEVKIVIFSSFCLSLQFACVSWSYSMSISFLARKNKWNEAIDCFYNLNKWFGLERVGNKKNETLLLVQNSIQHIINPIPSEKRFKTISIKLVM